MVNQTFTPTNHRPDPKTTNWKQIIIVVMKSNQIFAYNAIVTISTDNNRLSMRSNKTMKKREGILCFI